MFQPWTGFIRESNVTYFITVKKSRVNGVGAGHHRRDLRHNSFAGASDESVHTSCGFCTPCPEEIVRKSPRKSRQKQYPFSTGNNRARCRLSVTPTVINNGIGGDGGGIYGIYTIYEIRRSSTLNFVQNPRQKHRRWNLSGKNLSSWIIELDIS